MVKGIGLEGHLVQLSCNKQGHLDQEFIQFDLEDVQGWGQTF